jgi:hypothetical protein
VNKRILEDPLERITPRHASRFSHAVTLIFTVRSTPRVVSLTSWYGASFGAGSELFITSDRERKFSRRGAHQLLLHRNKKGKILPTYILPGTLYFSSGYESLKRSDDTKVLRSILAINCIDNCANKLVTRQLENITPRTSFLFFAQDYLYSPELHLTN